MMNQICGNKLQVESLVNTVFSQVCVFAEDEQVFASFETIEVDDNTVMLKWDTDNLTTEAQCMLNTALYYRFQDKTLSSELQIEHAIEKPLENHIRIMCNIDKYEEIVEDYCVYNNIPQAHFTALMYPLSLTMAVNKAEVLMINLTDEQMAVINRQGKTQVKANAIHQKVNNIGTALHTTSKVAMKDVVNPLAVNSAKVGATVISGLATTALDCSMAVANEVLRDVAKFSLSEVKKRDEVQTMKYSIRKILNKTNKPAQRQQANNFNL